MTINITDENGVLNEHGWIKFPNGYIFGESFSTMHNQSKLKIGNVFFDTEIGREIQIIALTGSIQLQLKNGKTYWQSWQNLSLCSNPVVYIGNKFTNDKDKVNRLNPRTQKIVKMNKYFFSECHNNGRLYDRLFINLNTLITEE